MNANDIEVPAADHLIHFEIEGDGFVAGIGNGSYTGWRKYRVPVSLFQATPEGKIPALEIASVICDRAEFYIDGRMIYEATPGYKSSMTVPLGNPKRREFEVCILLKAHPDPAVSSGFSVGITLSFIDPQ